MRLLAQYVLLGVCLAFGFLVVPLLALASAPSARADGPVLVIASPWADFDRLITLSGGRAIGAFPATFGQLGTSSDPEFVKRLKANGAWFALDGSSNSFLCGGWT